MTELIQARGVRRRSSPGGITSITVSGFKSLREHQVVEVRPLTILAGANSSGKSSIMQPLLLLKQTLEASYDPGPLLLNGPNVRFTSAEQLLSRKGQDDRAEAFQIGITITPEEMLMVRFGKEPSGGFALQEMVHRRSGSPVHYRRDMSQDDLKAAVSSYFPSLPRSLVLSVGQERAQDTEWIIRRDRCFFEVLLAFKGDQNLGALMGLGLRPGTELDPYVRGLIHVPGLRGNPERTYPVTAVGSMFPGTFESYTASVVAQWQEADPSAVEVLGEDLKRLGLTWKVKARRVNDTQVELQVGRLSRCAHGGAWDLVSIADVGFGVSQTLPVVVALRAAGPGQLVYLEQPEIHLHPRAQVAMAEIIAEAARRGVRVVVESHSSLFLLGVQTLVAEGRLAPDLVKLHWFRRNDDGSTEVNSADLDEAGAFGEWPEDFADVTLHAEDRYLSAAEAHTK